MQIQCTCIYTTRTHSNAGSFQRIQLHVLTQSYSTMHSPQTYMYVLTLQLVGRHCYHEFGGKRTVLPCGYLAVVLGLNHLCSVLANQCVNYWKILALTVQVHDARRTVFPTVLWNGEVNLPHCRVRGTCICNVHTCT